MNKFCIKWSSGREAEYETTQSEEEFRSCMFGHPQRLPDGVVFQVLEVKNAPETRKVEESDLGERQGRDGGREATEASGGDRPVEGGEVEAKKEVTPAKALPAKPQKKVK